MVCDAHFYSPRQGLHTHTVIFLHGRDSNAKEFAEELFESEASPAAAVGFNSNTEQDLTLPGLFPTVRWVFPTAPLLYSQRFDTDLSQWFDMWAVEDPEERSELQRDGLHQSIGAVLNSVIKAEEILVSRQKIFLCGISQGFATALGLFLAEGQGAFAGLIGLCSWMPFTYAVKEKMEIHENDSEMPLFSSLQDLYRSENDTTATVVLPARLKSTQIFLGHALNDNVVPVANAYLMRDVLIDLGFAVDWHEYEDGGHWVNEPQGVDDILHFMNRNLERQ